MFDIGFMELVLISIVALIVIGPERLPGAIRTATLWIGRAKRSFNQVKSEIEKEINADEIKRQLHNESILADLKKAKTQADSLVHNTRKNIDSLNAQVNETLKEEEAQLKEAVADKPAEVDAKPAKAKEPAAAPVDDPASIDEVEEPEQARDEETEETNASEADAEKEEGPITDFYNNPPSETVKVKGAIYRPTSSLDDETDSGRRS